MRLLAALLAGAKGPRGTSYSDDHGVPQLVLLRGVGEGTVWHLHPDATLQAIDDGAAGWRIGRLAEAHVALPEDPYVSADQCRLVATEDGACRLVDAAHATNRTLLNWKPLRPGETVPLTCGDVIGVGRSQLLYRLPPSIGCHSPGHAVTHGPAPGKAAEAHGSGGG